MSLFRRYLAANQVQLKASEVQEPFQDEVGAVFDLPYGGHRYSCSAVWFQVDSRDALAFQFQERVGCLAALFGVRSGKGIPSALRDRVSTALSQSRFFTDCRWVTDSEFREMT